MMKMVCGKKKVAWRVDGAGDRPQQRVHHKTLVEIHESRLGSGLSDTACCSEVASARLQLWWVLWWVCRVEPKGGAPPHIRG